MRRWGMVAAAIRVAARRDPDFLGLVDERGELTFRELDERSNALARAWREHGIDENSVLALLCRDHRGLLDAMFAAGKLGARMLLMNTGFAKPQFAAVAERESVTRSSTTPNSPRSSVTSRPRSPATSRWVEEGDDAGTPAHSTR